ncbi:MAG TPA: hypothetical protein PKK01_04140 [Mycobacterium sp.]|nr:MAG: hypothetical protein E6Q56_03010 [Mycobacterium sp.]HOB48488.1 hypothetical protein [Mycobacterium sp.]HPZ94229.1 hypothetical protein [Mycobacterium sp.]HQE16126.1 hypothetical protein [Mycobacterium sp.]
MSTWLSRLAGRLAVLWDPDNGPWKPCPPGWFDPEWGDADADLRRMHRDLDAIRVRYAEPR